MIGCFLRRMPLSHSTLRSGPTTARPVRLRFDLSMNSCSKPLRFADAIRTKIIREIAALPAPAEGLIRKVQAEAPVNCQDGDRWNRWDRWDRN